MNPFNGSESLFLILVSYGKLVYGVYVKFVHLFGEKNMSPTGGDALAITEKKPQRLGGCVGIFFQLFDWNRRFANKTQKLLTPAPAKAAPNKFGAGDKLPKLRLISDENNMGLSSGKKIGNRKTDFDKRHAMRTPSLVARLMGLDSLPSVQRDKLKKNSSSQIGVDRGDKFASDHCCIVKQDGKLEYEGSNHESRHQNLQKTGSSETRAVTRFGAEALHFRNVLSRSSKHHHPILAPVKSSESLSRRQASRLIGAATRILEPGLQARNRAKCALPCLSQKHHCPTDSSLIASPIALSQDQVERSTYYENTARLSMGHSSSGNCGNIVDIVDTRSYLEEHPSVSNYVDHSSFKLESRQKSPMSSIEPEKERILHNILEKIAPFPAPSVNNVNPRAGQVLDGTTLRKGGQTRWQLTSQQYKNQQVSPSTICYKDKIPIQNQVMLGKGRTPPRSTYSINLSKDVPINQSPSYQPSSRMPPKIERCRYVSERRLGDRRYDPLSSAGKQKSVDFTRQDDISNLVGSTIDKQINVNCNAMGGLDFESAICTDRNLARLGEMDRSGNNNNNNNNNNNSGVVSFALSPHMKQKDGVPAVIYHRRYQNECACSSSSQKNSVLDRNNQNGRACFQKSFPLEGDTLGVILEQKLKELNTQEDNELAQGISLPKRTSAVILQELISALAAERSFHVNVVVVRPNEIGESSYYEHPSGVQSSLKAKEKKKGARVRYSNDIRSTGNNNLSPLSVLEASFSYESCLSSSLDDGSVHKVQTDFTDWSYKETQLEPGLDLLQSTSLGEGNPGTGLVADFVNSISDILCSMDLVDSRLKGSKLAHAEEVILNAELVFGNTFQHKSEESKGFSISCFIDNELETLATVLWTNFGCFSGSDQDTEGNLLKGFLFDCVIEYLDSRYGGCIKSWRNQPVSMNTEMLIREVVEEIRSWTSWTGFVLDELIEKEMGKWTDLEVEAFETGVTVDGDILKFLVDEIVVELCERKLDCSV